MMGRNIIFHLYGEWYDGIEAGWKPEEYRKITAYWCKRVFGKTYPFDWDEMFDPDRSRYSLNDIILIVAKQLAIDLPDIDTITFVRGYTKKKMVFENAGISVGLGNPEWGAELGVNYFKFKLGRRLS